MTPQSYNLFNTQNSISTPTTLPQGSVGGLTQLARNLGIASGYGWGGVPLGPTATKAVTTPAPATTQTPQFNLGLTPSIKPTSSGGISFPAPSSPIATQQGQVPKASPQQDASYTGNTYQTPNGGSISLDASGNVSNFTPSYGYSINTSGAIPSSALGSSLTMNDLQNTRSQYADYVNALASAQGYSPDYINALNAAQKAQAQGAEIQSNFYTGNNLPGDTLPYAQGETARANAMNQLQQLSANQALQVQQLIRQGNIDAAKALVDAYAPQSVSPGSSLVSPVTGQTTYGGAGAYSDYQAQQTYFNLAQNFPDANIPSYNPQLSAQQNLQIAQQAAAQSPSFQSRNLVPVQLPGGGYSFVNKNQLITGANGQVSIISSGDAAQADAYKTAIGNLQNQQSQIQSQISTVDNNFPLLLNIVQKYGINQNLPLMNQFQNMADQQLGQSGITQLNAVATGLKATIAQIVSRGGSVDNQTRNEANALLPTNATFQVLNDLYSVVKAEGNGVINGINSEKQKNIDALNGIYNGASSVGGGSSSSQSTGASNGGSVGWY